MDPKLEINVLEDNDPVVVRFSGVLTRRTVASAFQRLDKLLRVKRPMVFEMSGISSIDSAGLALVANGIRRLGNGEDGLSLRGVRGELKEVFELAGWTFWNRRTFWPPVDWGWRPSLTAARYGRGSRKGSLGICRTRRGNGSVPFRMRAKP